MHYGGCRQARGERNLPRGPHLWAQQGKGVTPRDLLEVFVMSRVVGQG